MDIMNFTNDSITMLPSHPQPPRPARMLRLARSLRSIRSLSQLLPQPDVKEVLLDCDITSPSTIMLDDYGMSNSLLSGTLRLQVLKDYADIESLSGALHMHIKYKRPFRKGCSDCKHKKVEIKDWHLIGQEIRLREGNHAFPFHIDIPASSKASVQTSIISVYYEFTAEVVYKSGNTNARSGGSANATFKRIIPVRRRLSIPDSPLCCVKTSPSTGIEIECCYNSIISPIGVNKVQLKFNQLRSPYLGRDSLVWCLQKGSWRLKEHIMTSIEPCRHHCNDQTTHRGESRSMTRILAGKDFYDGWQLDKNQGTGNMEIDVAISQKPTNDCELFTRDAYGNDDVKVAHFLAIELVFVAEILKDGNPNNASRIGAVRMLCTEFRIAIDEPTAEKANWMNEIPPFYDDLWPSPPGYGKTEEFNLLR